MQGHHLYSRTCNNKIGPKSVTHNCLHSSRGPIKTITFLILAQLRFSDRKVSIVCRKRFTCSTPSSEPNCIGGVIVSVLTSSAIDRRLEPRSGQTKDYTIGICCFSAKHAALRRKSKDCLARNQNNLSEWNDMSTGPRHHPIEN